MFWWIRDRRPVSHKPPPRPKHVRERRASRCARSCSTAGSGQAGHRSGLVHPSTERAAGYVVHSRGSPCCCIAIVSKLAPALGSMAAIQMGSNTGLQREPISSPFWILVQLIPWTSHIESLKQSAVWELLHTCTARVCLSIFPHCPFVHSVCCFCPVFAAAGPIANTFGRPPL